MALPSTGWLPASLELFEPLDMEIAVPYVITYRDGGNLTTITPASQIRTIVVGNYDANLISGFDSNGDSGFVLTLTRRGVHGMALVDTLVVDQAIRLNQERCPATTVATTESCPATVGATISELCPVITQAIEEECNSIIYTQE